MGFFVGIGCFGAGGRGGEDARTSEMIFCTVALGRERSESPLSSLSDMMGGWGEIEGSYRMVSEMVRVMGELGIYDGCAWC